MKVLPETASGCAHGKIILIGEHAVVHNEPAIAIPFTSANVKVVIESIPGETMIDSIYHKGKISEAPETLNNLIRTLEAVCNYFEVAVKNMKITITSNIPAERGMGSSAAVATALVRALFNFFGEKLTDDLLEGFVSISEKIAHGNPSGLDAKVVRSKQAVYFIRDQQADYFDSSLPAFLVVADTGDHGETIHAVTDVSKLMADETSSARQWVKELGDLTKNARQFIEDKNVHALGKVLSQAQTRLKNLTVSNEKLDVLIEAALKNGAIGAKLTGGGRGGCMIALVEKKEQAEKLAQSLLAASAVKTWIHPLGAQINDK